MGLFGSPTEVELEVASPGPLQPGATFELVVRLGEPDRKVRSVRWELRYDNTYREEHETSTDDGVSSTSSRTTTSTVTVDLDQVFDGEPPTAGEWRIPVELPEDTPPSATGAVEWEARAVVDRRRAPDVTRSVPLTVVAPADLHAAWATRPPVPGRDLEGSFALTTRVLRPGDTVSGQVHVTAVREIAARSVRAQLRRVHDGKGAAEEKVATSEDLAGPLELAAGETRAFPVQLTVPTDAPPSFEAAWSEQHWFVEVVLDRRLRGDRAVGIEVVVANA